MLNVFRLAGDVSHLFSIIGLLLKIPTTRSCAALVILPQLVLLQRSRNIDNLTGNYIFFLGAHRGLFILNWIYRFFAGAQWILWISGLVQTALYLTFPITISRVGRIKKHLNSLLKCFIFLQSHLTEVVDIKVQNKLTWPFPPLHY